MTQRPALRRATFRAAPSGGRGDATAGAGCQDNGSRAERFHHLIQDVEKQAEQRTIMTYAEWEQTARRVRRWILAILCAGGILTLCALSFWGGAHSGGATTTAVYWLGLAVYVGAFVVVMLINKAQHNLYTFEMKALEAGVTAKNDQLSALLITVADYERMKRSEGSAVQ